MFDKLNWILFYWWKHQPICAAKNNRTAHLICQIAPREISYEVNINTNQAVNLIQLNFKRFTQIVLISGVLREFRGFKSSKYTKSTRSIWG